MVSGACRCGVSELSSENGMGRNAKWMGGVVDCAEVVRRQAIPVTASNTIEAQAIARNRAFLG